MHLLSKADPSTQSNIIRNHNSLQRRFNRSVSAKIFVSGRRMRRWVPHFMFVLAGPGSVLDTYNMLVPTNYSDWNGLFYKFETKLAWGRNLGTRSGACIQSIEETYVDSAARAAFVLCLCSWKRSTWQRFTAQQHHVTCSCSPSYWVCPPSSAEHPPKC
jgi:hypothetical protein